MTERPKSSHEPSSAKEPIVFVVEDDVSMRGALSNLFESVGLVVELFGSAFATSAAKDTLSETPALSNNLPRLRGLKQRADSNEF